LRRLLISTTEFVDPSPGQQPNRCDKQLWDRVLRRLVATREILADDFLGCELFAGTQPPSASSASWSLPLSWSGCRTPRGSTPPTKRQPPRAEVSAAAFQANVKTAVLTTEMKRLTSTLARAAGRSTVAE
jgi:hypothetical protein